MNKSNSLFDKQLIKESLGASVRKLDPRTMIKNPIMFTVEIVTAVMFVLLFYILISGDTTQGSFGYNLVVFVVLFITLLFANFARRSPKRAAKRRPIRCAKRARRPRPNWSTAIPFVSSAAMR